MHRHRRLRGLFALLTLALACSHADGPPQWLMLLGLGLV